MLKSTVIDNDHFYVTQRLITLFKAPVSFDPYLLWYHPGYPGLLAIKDTLLSLGFSVDGFHIGDRELEGMPMPALIQLQNSNGDRDLVIVRNATSKNVSIETFRSGRITLSSESIAEKWDGNFLAISYNDDGAQSSEKNARQLQPTIKRILFLSVILLLMSIVFFAPIDVIQFTGWPLALTSIAGLFLSVALTLKHLEIYRPTILEKFCEQGNFSCASVQHFSMPGILPGITVSEIAGIYNLGVFSGWFWCMFTNQTNDFMHVNAWLSLFTLPVICYTIYLQKFVIHKWCALCLLMHALLLMNIVITMPHFSLSWSAANSLYAIIQTGFFLMISLVWSVMKLLLMHNSTILSYKESKATFRTNTKFFDSVLNSSKAVDIPFPSDISLGSTAGKYHVFAVLSTDCTFCFTVGRDLLALKEIFSDDIRIEIIFVSHATNNDSLLNDIINKTNSPEVLMKRWLETEKLEKGLKKELSGTSDDRVMNIVEMRKRWLNSLGVTGTPQVYINRARMTSGLRPLDFIYYLRTKINYDDQKNPIDNDGVLADAYVR